MRKNKIKLKRKKKIKPKNKEKKWYVCWCASYEWLEEVVISKE